ncbi:Leucine-rich receptor-like protein kinase family protein [Euphorbia peplus]|nr:Leucine-rich receptor-like protein kinase family protein [Euphorbia peplus]
MAPNFVFFLFLSLLYLIYPSQAIPANQSRFFDLMKTSLSGNALLDWDITPDKSFCEFRGVSCNSRGYVDKLDITGWSVSGPFPTDICSYLPQLRVLRLGRNRLHGDFLPSIINCSLLEELNTSRLYLSGTLPDFSPLKYLQVLDMSYNLFRGEFPISVVTNLSNLEYLNFNENAELDYWQLPENISRMTKLKIMVLMTCKITGPIPATIGNMTSLVDLELGGNLIVGHIPVEIGLLKNLQQLELYYNYLLSGNIPEELGNLKELIDLDISVTNLTGNIPEFICRLPKLEVFQAYNNSLSGRIPGCIANSTSLRILSLYENSLTGDIPPQLGNLSAMEVLDLSENKLSGPLPTQVCKGGKLKYLLVMDNMLSGELPDSYVECVQLLRFRVSHNYLEGSIPQGILGLPHVSIIDLSYNNFSGSIPRTFGNARNLSEFFLQNNKISGIVPPEISRAINLVKIDFSNNLLSGSLPFQIGYLTRLNSLMLQGNNLSSSIPNSLSYLKSLNVLDLSSNGFTGSVPENLTKLLPNSINFANNHLSGPIPLSLIRSGLLESFSGNPGLCVPVYVSSAPNFPICSQNHKQQRLNCIWVIGVSAVIIVVGALLFLKRKLNKERFKEREETMSSSILSYNVKSFHRVNFDQQEIFRGMIPKNEVGRGGSGTVYKIQLSSGDVIAVKKLWSKGTKDSAPENQLVLDKGLKTEVETLGSIRHKNIVKLYCYFSSLDCNLLIYEYMTNGNLRDALDKDPIHLDWPTRHQIALGVAQGLAYLHHDLLTPIIHRDIKSTNILLDVNYQSKVADFGIAKVLQARGGKDSTTTAVVGTYGYMAPEYAYSSKATTKCDVYSFGVVLLELITGKKPVEADFGENKNIINWVSAKVETKGVVEVLDEQLSKSFWDEMIQVLRIALRCTCNSPGPRPTMNEVVQLLIEADPCGFDSRKSSNKTKESTNVHKIISNN